MKFTDLFIKRPVLAIVVNLLIVIAGLQAVQSLSVRQYPRSDLATISVSTAYVGADAELVRGFVTTPLERAIASTDGIDFMESSSRQSGSTVTVHLKLNYDTNAALTQIQSKVAQVRNDLPPEAEVPVINLQVADSQRAAMYIGFSSDALDQNQITDYLARVVQPKLTALDGVQRADVLGDRTFAMRVWLDPQKMAARGISPSAVRTALAANNVLSAIGQTKGSMVSVNLTANTDLQTADEFRQLVVKEENGEVVRLGDVADVVLGAANYDSVVEFNGETAIFIGIWALPTANTLEVTAAVQDAIPEIRAQLPAGMQVAIPYDSSEFVESALKEVVTTLAEALVIVILVIFLFLGSPRAVMMPLIAIPISLIGAVFLMAVAGFTINLLTLLAIVLSVGIVVDDAIIVVENIERHLHMGQSPFEAAIHAARELVGPIIAVTITLAAVYTPIAIQGGLTGSLFREFAFTLAGAVIISGIVALTLTPMMGSRLLRSGDTERGFAGWVNDRFEMIRERYTRLLVGTLKSRPVVLTVWGLVALLAVPLYLGSPKELAPTEDQGSVFGIMQAAPNATLDQTVLFASQYTDILLQIPETAATFQITRPGGGFGGVRVVPWSERDRSTQEIQADLAQKVASIPGIRVIPTVPAALPGGGGFAVDFVIGSTREADQLQEVAARFVDRALGSGMFQFADSDLKFDQPQAEVVFDHDKLRTQGVSLAQAGRDLATMLGGNYVNRFSIQGRSYKVIPQVRRAERLTPQQLQDIYITGGNGDLVQLSTFAHIETSARPRELKRFQQLNAVRIQGVPNQGVSLDQALSVLEDEAATLPSDFSVDYAGESRQLRVEGGRFLGTFLLSLVLIYLVLAAQFESFRDPFIILGGSVPLAIAGALVFSFLEFTTLNIYSQVGLITLVGLIAKNGILIVEFANSEQQRGRDRYAAAIAAAGTRLRPVLMTTAATVLGYFPLLIASGPGAAARFSIGIMLVSGMIIGTAFTLFVVPAIYTVIARERSATNVVGGPNVDPNIIVDDTGGEPPTA